MNEEMYLDALERIIAVTESLLDLTVSVAAMGVILNENGICTSDEIEKAKDFVRENIWSIEHSFGLIEERKAEIARLKGETL